MIPILNSVASRLLLISLISLTIFSCADHKLPPAEPDIAETVYIGSDKLYAINAIIGVKKWEFTTGYFIQSSPTVSNGIVYTGTGDLKIGIGNEGHKFYAIEAASGIKNGSLRREVLSSHLLW